MRALITVLFAIITMQVHTQEPVSDSVRILSEVVVSARRIERFSAGLQVRSLEKKTFENYPSSLLSDFLSRQHTHFIKTYGTGGLSTISMRGTASQHTAIYWNGFSINPPNIYMADLSMLPLFLFNRVDLVSGGSSTLFGNGSIGGSIHLNSQNGHRGNKLRVALSVGQFRDRLIAVKSDYKVRKFLLSTSIWLNDAENDFVFINLAKAGKPEERLSNADALQMGLLQELHFPISSHEHLRAGIWFQKREAGIPPTMTMQSSHARQLDRMLRAYLQWNLEKDGFAYSLKTAYNNDFINYEDSLINLDSEIRVSSWISEAELILQILPNTSISSGVNFQLNNAKVDAYLGQVDSKQFSMFMLAKHNLPDLNWVFTAGARKEFHNNFESVPTAISLGWSGRLINILSGRINLSSNYRTPTLNDLYWNPGGNPDLLAESSLNAEAGVDLILKNERWALDFAATVFSSRIKNWITWLPASLNYWSPENIEDVMTYGFEAKAEYSFRLERFIQKFETAYSNTKSLYGETALHNPGVKPQLIYTPVHTASLSYTLRMGTWSIQYFHKLTGSRFTDRANTNKLPAFHTADFSLTRKVSFFKSSITINAMIKNLTNHAYQVIQYRPMPGRSFHISLIFDQLFQKQLQTNTKLQ